VPIVVTRPIVSVVSPADVRYRISSSSLDSRRLSYTRETTAVDRVPSFDFDSPLPESFLRLLR